MMSLWSNFIRFKTHFTRSSILRIKLASILHLSSNSWCGSIPYLLTKLQQLEWSKTIEWSSSYRLQISFQPVSAIDGCSRIKTQFQAKSSRTKEQDSFSISSRSFWMIKTFCSSRISHKVHRISPQFLNSIVVKRFIEDFVEQLIQTRFSLSIQHHLMSSCDG